MLDLEAHRLQVESKEVELTKLEFDLLRTLIENKSSVLSREFLLEHVWKSDDFFQDKTHDEYIKELITKHVSGRLKVAPEHTSDEVLSLMRKPSFKYFGEFKQKFERINKEAGLNQQLIPYFISSHPGCKNEDMAELAALTKSFDFKLEQVQDFTPTPMTLATEIYYSGYNPYTLEPTFTAKSKDEKLEQRKFFFWYKGEYKNAIIRDLQKMQRPDLMKKLFDRF
jgi:uncharacterized radical SAM protein YgiQ